jgi:hypothetical protein
MSSTRVVDLGNVRRSHANAAARTRIVEQNIALGRRLAELRDTMPSNRKFGAAVRKLGHDDPLHVAEVMRVARRYGDKPEIYTNVSWHALTELASTSTSEDLRQQFEDRISAGERVSGTEVIRARHS